MSFDLAVWFPDRRLSDRKACRIYDRLCLGVHFGLKAHPSVSAFYKELTELHPDINDVPENRVGDFDYCPWSASLDRSDRHVLMTCVWSKAEYVAGLVEDLARKHGLAVFDPQGPKLYYPDGTTSTSDPWWKLWN